QNGEDEPHADKAGYGKANDAQERKSPQERPPARLHDEGRADDEGGDDDPRGQPVPHDVEAMNQVFQALVAELDFQLSRPPVVHHAVHFAGHADDDLRELEDFPADPAAYRLRTPAPPAKLLCEGLRQGEHVEIEVQQLARTFHRQESFAQQHEVRRQAHPVTPGQLKTFSDDAPHFNLAQRFPVVAVDEELHILGEHPAVYGALRDADAHQHVDDPLRVPGDEGQKQVRDLPQQLVVQSPHQAEIQETDDAVFPGANVLRLQPLLHQAREAVQNFQIGVYDGLDVRPPHLHCHLCAIVEDSPVHLADGGSGHRLRLEGAVRLLQGHPQLFLNDG